MGSIMAEFAVDRADDAILPACFALLPQLASPDAIVFAARAMDGSLLGAAGALWRPWQTPAGLPTWIEVLPEHRRGGVGRALLDALVTVAAQESDRLWSVRPIDEASDAARFAIACGATADKRQLYFETTNVDFLTQMTRIVDRLTARGKVSDDFVVEALAERHLEQVKWLIFDGLTTPPPQLEAMLARAMTEPPETAPIDRERSFVLIADGVVAGALLSQRVTQRTAANIVCNVVDPRWRRGAANALLLRRFSEETVAHGHTRIRFDCDEHVRDTIGLARRSEADHLRTESYFAYAIAARIP